MIGHVDQPEIRGWLPHGLLPPQIEIVETRPTRQVLMIRQLDRTLRLPPLDARQIMFWHLDYF